MRGAQYSSRVPLLQNRHGFEITTGPITKRPEKSPRSTARGTQKNGSLHGEEAQSGAHSPPRMAGTQQRTDFVRSTAFSNLEQRLPLVLPLHRYFTVHHYATVSSSARRRMCSAHVSPLPQLDAADHLRPHCHMPPLALPLRLRTRKYPQPRRRTPPPAQHSTRARTGTRLLYIGCEFLALLAQDWRRWARCARTGTLPL